MTPTELGRRVSASRDPVVACARVLGIAVRRRGHHRDRCPYGPSCKYFESGFDGGGICIKSGWVYLAGTAPGPALHELMHILCDPPDKVAESAGVGHGLCATKEDWILLQVERAYGKAILPRSTYLDLVDAQGSFEQFPGDEGERPVALGEVNPWSLPWWREGYDIARRVGLLDGNRRPTFRRPDWARL